VKSESNRYLLLKNDFNAILSIGIIQGLASNDELFLVLVFTLGINDLSIVILGIIFFSLGVMTGMISWSSLINLPGVKAKKEIIIKYLNVIMALVALVYGFYCLLGGEGINLIPINI
jgi:cadmium resistance protein CadD (predicted permease)